MDSFHHLNRIQLNPFQFFLQFFSNPIFYINKKIIIIKYINFYKYGFFIIKSFIHLLSINLLYIYYISPPKKKKKDII